MSRGALAGFAVGGMRIRLALAPGRAEAIALRFYGSGGSVGGSSAALRAWVRLAAGLVALVRAARSGGGARPGPGARGGTAYQRPVSDTVLRTEAALVSMAAFSASVSSNSRIFSMPSEPTMQGTPK